MVTAVNRLSNKYVNTKRRTSRYLSICLFGVAARRNRRRRRRRHRGGEVRRRQSTAAVTQGDVPRSRSRRAATARTERLWDHGVIPYEIEANFSGTFGHM